jgi:hypothetical protein
MNELEKKFSCLCGSEVKEANRKAHEKTKKHTNYQQTHGTSNLILGQNLPIPKAVRKLQQKQKYEPEEHDELEEDDDYEDGDGQDDGFEEELLQAIEAIHQGVESLLIGQKQINKEIRESADIHLFNVKPIITNICERLKRIEEELTSRVPVVSGTTPEPSKWINDKCTQRNA